MAYYLSVDIGGTNLRIAAVEEKEGMLSLYDIKKYKISDVSSISETINRFLKTLDESVGEQISSCAIGVAGRIQNNCCNMTNYDMSINGNEIQKNTSIEKVYLINDIKAAAYYLDYNGREIICFKEGNQPKFDTKLLVIPGTGLGESVVYYDEANKMHVLPTEGGHADIAPRDEVQRNLIDYLINNNLCDGADYPGWETVLSGRGIYNLYRFLKDSGEIRPEKIIHQEIVDAGDKGRIISEYAHQGNTECETVFYLFFRLLAQELGSLALRCLSTGGIFLGGNIIARNMDLLRKSDFLATFNNTKSPEHVFDTLIKEIPIYVLPDSDLNIYGAVRYLMMMG